MKKISMLKALMLCLAALNHYALQAQKITWEEGRTEKKGILSPPMLSKENDNFILTYSHATIGLKFSSQIKTVTFDNNFKFVKETATDIGIGGSMNTSVFSSQDGMERKFYKSMVEAMRKSSIDKKPYTIKARSFGSNSFYVPDLRKMATNADSTFLLCNIEEERNNNRIEYAIFNKAKELKEGVIQLPSDMQKITIMASFVHSETKLQFMLGAKRKGWQNLLLSFDTEKKSLEITELPISNSITSKGIAYKQFFYFISLESSKTKNYTNQCNLRIYDIDGKLVKEQINKFSSDFINEAKSENGLVSFKDWIFTDDIAINDYGQIVINGEYNRKQEIQKSSGSFQPTRDSRTGRTTMAYKDNTRSINTGMYMSEINNTYVFFFDTNNNTIKNFVIQKNQAGQEHVGYLSTKTISNGKDFFIFFNDYNKNLVLQKGKYPKKYVGKSSIVAFRKLSSEGVFETKILTLDLKNKKLKDAILNLKSLNYNKEDNKIYGAGSIKYTLSPVSITLE